MDCWLDNAKKKTFFGFTVHFLTEEKNEFQLHDRILATRELHAESKSGEYLLGQILDILREFNLDAFAQEIVFVSDRGSNIIKALRTYENNNCFAHMIHNTVCNMLDTWKNTLRGVKSLVKYFKVTGTNSQLPLSLKSFVKTRWNSVYFMLRTVIQMWDHIVDLLTKKNELKRISGINKQELIILCDFLEIFKECTAEVEASRVPTLHLVIPWYFELHAHMKQSYLDIALIAKMKDVGLKYFEENVSKRLNKYHKVATFLHPVLKNLKMFNLEERAVIYKAAEDLLTRYDQFQPTPSCRQQTTTSQPKKVSKALARFSGPDEPPIDVSDYESRRSEIERYISVNQPSEIENVLSWWYANRQTFPRLHRLACFLFAIPASSASVERVFSTAGHCVKDRPNLKGI